MTESIHKYFKVGAIQWMTHPPAQMELTESIRQFCCDDFFDAIEIGKMPDDLTRDKVKSMLDHSHLKVCYGAQPRLLGPKLNPNDLDEAGRFAAEKTLLEAVDEASYLGAKGIAFLSGKWTPEHKDGHYAQLIKTTLNICKYAATKDMMVELEVFDFDIDKASLIGPAPYAAKFAADMRCRCNNFGLMVDLSHFPTTYETSKFCIQTMRPYITHFHIGNAVIKEGLDGYGDLHPRFGYPGSANDVDELVDFFRVLRDEGFFNADDPYVLSFEVTPRPGEDPHIIMANCKRVINRAWALV